MEEKFILFIMIRDDIYNTQCDAVKNQNIELGNLVSDGK